jgi:Protein of Unknown function (DUF2784)
MKTERSWGYRIANAASHALHIAIIVFVAIGWLIPVLQLPHLFLIASTLVCWFVLGFWFGFGYCPITDWHWKIKDKWGEGRPQTSYIHSGLEFLLGKSLSTRNVDLSVGTGTVVIAVIAVIKYFTF